jgi:bacterioferritin-associated ferredoxin
MQDHDEICLCFSVTRRKLVNFVRVERPQRESQMSQCFGAGTGCGWCRPFLKAIFLAETGMETDDTRLDKLTASEYATLRKQYHRRLDID